MYEFEEKKLKSLIKKDILKLFQQEKVIIAGGCITSIFTKHDINDIDVYCRNKQSLLRILDKIKANYNILAFTNKATLFRTKNKGEDQDIQLIHFKYFDNAEEIFNTFDFTVCMGAYDFETEKFVFHKDFFKHNSQRTLHFNTNTAYPIVSALRLQKYQDKGYSISKAEFLKIMITINNFKINTYKELKEQLGGMYGVSYDKLFKNIKDDNKVDAIEILNKLSEAAFDEEYFTEKDEKNYCNELIKFINQQYFDNESYDIYLKSNRYFCVNKNTQEVNKVFDKKDVTDEINYIEDNNKIIIVYKNVKKSGENKLVSFYDNNFVYEIGKVIKAKNNRGLFFSKSLKEVEDVIYSDEDDRVILKCYVNLNNVRENGEFEFVECIPLEIIESK